MFQTTSQFLTKLPGILFGASRHTLAEWVCKLAAASDTARSSDRSHEISTLSISRAKTGKCQTYGTRRFNTIYIIYIYIYPHLSTYR